ncbi:MAG: FAD-binding oxidoreductase [Candidatus Lokiarchaeota archaeon]|nr:FAD-binding oxidoreductase [Candidatus Lokiarchaeota archaeon]
MNNHIDTLVHSLAKICGSKNISVDPNVLNPYSSDMSFFKGNNPNLIVWPSKTQEVTKIIKLANQMDFSIVPVSSSSNDRHHGDTIPRKDNCIIMNLTKMDKILSIDKKNRVVMIEPGVTFEKLIPKLQQSGLRLLLPLYPTGTKSVLTSVLEREPIIIPRYHWDTSDPLLCTEVVFGTGDLFRTGTAAGPGTLSQQKKAGQAHVNPMGPTQFSPYRVIQGAQGSLGIVTWATMKLEFIPSEQKVFHYHSNNIEELLDFQQKLANYRLCDETFILNNLNLACLVKKSREEIENLTNSLLKWNLIYILAGRGNLAIDKLNYLEGDINDLMRDSNLTHLESSNLIDKNEILECMNNYTAEPWRTRYKGSYQDIFFISNFENIPKYIKKVELKHPENLGIYIQPINQGTSYHCEFDLFYDSENGSETNDLEGKFNEISIDLMDCGAFFNRPYGYWAREVYARHIEQTSTALRKVKKIFDPNNVLNPGVLCFDK